MKTLILGLGNELLTDDGVGIYVAEAVRRSLEEGPAADIAVEAAGLGGLALMERMLGYERAILIDALLRTGGEPGALRRMTLDEIEAISPTEHSSSPHDASLTAAIRLGRQVGLQLPEEIVIYAVEVSNVCDFAEAPTPAVAAAIPRAVAAVLAELGGSNGIT